MPTSFVASDSLLAIDVGSVHTRAALFDVVASQYRYLATGVAQTTAEAPYNDIREGIGTALDRLSEITGRTFIDKDERLITPSRVDGSGVGSIVATISAGAPLKVVVVGLLEDVSLESATNLSKTTYALIADRLWLNDHRKTDERINAIMRIRPDLFVVAGGVDGGANQTVLRLLEAIGLASYLKDESLRPEIFFVGNNQMIPTVKNTLGTVGNIHFAPNVRPDLDIEQLGPAHVQLAEIFRNIRSRQIPGVIDLDAWSKTHLLPSSMAMGRVIRSLSKVYAANKGVLGIDIGASATVLAASLGGDLSIGVYPEYGLGKNLEKLLSQVKLDEISRWFHLDISDQYLQDYLYNKSIYPSSIPISKEDLDIEEALGRVMMRLSMSRLSNQLKMHFGAASGDGCLYFEPILASGSVLTKSVGWAHTLLMLLDGLQPAGITTIVLDYNHLIPALGAAAAVNPLLVVQSIDNGTFLNLCPVINPIGLARYGAPIMQVRITYENGAETKAVIKMGSLHIFPQSSGQNVQIHLHPYHHFDVGMGGAGRSGRLQVSGGALGVVIDARGRPLRLSKDPGRRREMANYWLKVLSSK